MLTEQRTEFFDVADFEFIADQYIDKSQFSMLTGMRNRPSATSQLIIVKVKSANLSFPAQTSKGHSLVKAA